jgi:hypothetical protein
MTNAAMMNVDWRELTWWEYQARLWTWNDRHPAGDGKQPASEPDYDRLRKAMAVH